MENFYEQIKNIVATSKIITNRAVIIGAGDVTTTPEFLADKLVIYINNAIFKHDIIKNSVIFIKNRETLKKLLENNISTNDSFVVIPKDIININEYGKIKNALIIRNFDQLLNLEYNPFNNPIIFGCNVAKSVGITNITLVGFTFEVNENEKYNRSYFYQQKQNFDKYKSENPDLIINVYCSNRSKSKLSVREVINYRLKNNETVVVAEFTNNHLGDTKTLLEMVEQVKDQGADLVKIQKRDVDNFYSEEEKNKKYESPFGTTLYDYRKAVELTIEQLQLLNEKCEELNIPWFSTVLDYKSYTDLERIRPQELIKIPSTISLYKEFISQMAEQYPRDKDIVISTGATDAEYVKYIINKFYDDNRRLFLLHTLSAYPTPLEKINIGIINLYKKYQTVYTNLIPGYSGHDIGNLGTQFAVVAGAMMVEKHVKLKDSDWIHFDSVAVSLYKKEFADYVKAVRMADIYRGSEQKIVHSVEHHKYIPKD